MAAASKLCRAGAGSVAVALGVLFTSSALAQSSAEAEPVDDEQAGEIIVTAQKREQNLQDVGLSISAYSGDDLRRLGITEATQITQQVPGLHVSAWSPNVTIFNLRGISQNNFLDNLEAPVAVYADDAYMGSINGISGQLFDIERVEVLRGPQGTLFGRNATGGLIHYVSKDASSAAFNGYSSLSFERFNRVGAEAAAGGSISDWLRYRVAARYVRGGNYIRSADAIPGVLTGNGQNLGGDNGFALRGTLQADLGPSAVLDLWVKHSEDNNVDTGGYVYDNCTFEPNGFCNVDAAGLGAGTTGVINGITGEPASPFANFSNDRGNLDREVDSYQAKLRWDIGDGLELTGIGNYMRLRKSYVEDGDAIPLTIVRFATDARYRQFTQELRLSGEHGAVNWQVGGYYLDIDLTGQLVTQGAPVTGAAVDINGSVNDPQVREHYALGSRNWSLFGQAEVELSPLLTVIGGLRYSKDNKSIDYASILLDAGFPDAQLASDELFEIDLPGVSRIRHGDWAARASLNIRPADDVLLFVSYNRGIKGGNWTLSPNVQADNFQHRPEVLNSFEAGFKLTSNSNRLRLNGTLFHYIYSDYQVFAIVGGTPQVTNSDAHATGAELELFWSPVSGVDIALGGTWETSSVDEVQAVGEMFAPELFPGAPSGGACTNQGGFFFCDFPQDVIRNAELPNAPRFSANYLLRYSFDAPGGQLAVQVDGAWYGDQYLEVTNGRSSLQPSYNVTNASVRWTSENEAVEIEAFARNVFNEAYRAYTLNLGVLGTTAYFAPPAVYGARVTLRW